MRDGKEKNDSQISIEKENLNIDEISRTKNNFESKDQFFNDFDSILNISNIENDDNNEIKIEKNTKIQTPIENGSIDKSLRDDFENIDKINIVNEDINETSLQIDINNENKEEKKIRTKDDLNDTPIPIFECSFCANEKVVFQHYIREILSDKYLLQTSVFDINDLEKLICNKRYINKDEKSEKLLNLVIKNMEYIKLYIPKDKSIIYFKSNVFQNLCQKNEIDNHRLFRQKIEDSIVRKKKDSYFRGINRIPRNSMNNKCLFNSTNSLINNFNALSGLVEPVAQINPNINNIKNNFTIASCSNNSINFNSLSLNNNEFNYYCKDNNNLDYIVEKIEKNDGSVSCVDDKEEILNFFKFDLSRKIAKKDIKWENKYYDIWNPDISSDFDENDLNENDYNYNIKDMNVNEDNKNKSINININYKYLIKNKNINKSMGYIKYNIPKKNIIFKFNKNKGKKFGLNEINKNTSNNIIKNSIEKNNNSKNYSIKYNKGSISRDKDISTNKSSVNYNINKSHDLSKYSNKYINNYSNYNNNSNYNHKNLLSDITFLKNKGLTTNSVYNINKSAHFVNKNRQRISYNKKDNNNINTKSLQYISSSSKNNSSNNFSIGVSINLKANSSIKSNGIINCLNPKNISQFQINGNKNIKNNSNNINNKILINQNIDKKNRLFNLFNNIDILNLNHNRARSNYNKYKTKQIIGKNKFKNYNKKNNFSKKNLYHYSVDKKKANGIISRTNDLLYSSNSIFNNINNKKSSDALYTKSLGLSFGSNDNNISENTTNIVFNSVSNFNKSNSNLNNSNNCSPYKFNQTYYTKNSKEFKNKINDLVYLINKGNNNSHDLYLLNNNNVSNFKNKSINCFNFTSYLDKHKYKKAKILCSNKSN